MANRYWVGGTGTWTTTTTNWSASSGGPGGATAPTAADSVFFDQAATYTVTMTGALACLDITVSAGTVTFATGTTPTLAVSGSMSLVTGTVWNSTGTITFNSATTGRTITTNGTTLNAPVTFNSTGSWLLGSTLTVASARTTTLTQGTLNLNGFDLSTGFFTTAASGARSVAFGTNNIVLTAASGTALSMPAIGGFTWSGTGGFTADANVVRTYTVGTTTGNSTPPNLTFTGSGTAVPVLTTGSYFGKLDFGTTAFTLAVTRLNVYTALILSTGGTFTNLSIAWAGTGTITTNGKPIAALDIANTTGTVTLAGALSCTVYTHVSGTIDFANFNLTCSSTAEFRTGTLSNIGTISCTSFTVSTGGTLTLTSGTITPSTSFVVTGNGKFNYNGGTLSPVPTFTHTLGTVTFNKAYALTPTGTYVLNTGELILNGFDLTVGIFSSGGSTVRSVAFGANNIILAHTSAAQVVLSMNVSNNFTWTGTGGFVTDASVTRSYNFGTSTAYKPNLTFTGTGSATQTFVASSYYNKIDFGSTTCSVGTELRANSLILSPGGTYTNLTPIMTGTGFITSNGKAIAGLNIQGDTTFTDQPTFATATAILTLGSGNLNLSGFDLTVGEFRGTGSSTRSITFGANNIILAHTTAGTTVLAAAAATNFTWTGTGGFVTDASITRSYNFGSTDGSIAAAPNLTFTGSGTAIQTISNNSWFKNLDFGTTAFVLPAATVYVNTLTLSSGGTFTGLQPILTRTQTWTAQFSKQLAGLGFNLAGGTLTLDGTQTYIANSTFRLAQGTLDLGGYDLTVGIFSSNATETRSIAFGSNKIILNHTTAGTTVLSMGTASNFSYTGTGQFITDASITRTFTFGTGGGATSTNSPSLSFTGSGTAIQTLSTGSAFNNLDFGTTSFALPGTALSVSSLTLSSTGTYSNLVLTMFGTGTITPNGKSISSFIVNCPGGTTTLAGALTTGVTAITALTAGTLNLAGFTLTTGTFSSNNSNARGIGFGTGNIVLSHTTAATTVLAVSTATNFTTSGTGGFVSDASITRTYQFGSTAGGSATNAPNLSLTGSGTAVQTFIGDSWFDVLNFGTTAFTVPTATVNVDTLTLSSGGTFTGLTPQFTRTQTWTAQFSKQLGGIGVNTPGVTLTFDSTQTYFAQIILTAGTLNLGGNDLTTALLSSSNSNPRSIAFGSNNIILSSGVQAQTLLSMANATSFTYTGTGGFVTSSLGTKTLTFGTTGGTSTNAPNLTFTDSGTSVTTLTSGSWFNKLDFGTVSFTLPATTLNLNSIVLSTNTNGGSTAFLTAIMVGTGTITPNGKRLAALTINHTGTTTLAGALDFGETVTRTEVTTLTSGTLDLAGFNLTTATFSSSNTNTRSIAFGSGFINLVNSSSNQVVLSMADATNFTWTGTGGFVADGTVTRICRFGNTAGGTSTNAPNLAVTRGINDLVVTLTTGSWFNTLQFFGTIYTVPTTALNVNNLILSTNGTFTGLSINAVGTGTITTNGKTIAGFTVNNDSGTTTLADALSCASYTQTSGTINFATLNLTCSGTATYTAGTLTNIGTISCSTWVCAGTFTMTHGTITPGISFVVQGGFNYNSGTLSPVGTFTQTSGTVTLGQAYALASTSTYTLTAGTLNLNGYDLTTGVFASSNSNVRSVVFGANNIILVYALNSAIVLSMTNATNFTYTGTGGFVSTMSFSRSFRFGDTSGGSVDNAPNLTLITGASSITLFSDSWFNKLDFGSTTFTLATTTLNLESLTLSTSGTYTSLTVNAVGTGTITPNGKTIAALTINHSGTTTLAGALTTAATAITTLTAGTLDLAGYTMTTGALSSSNTNTRSIAFGTGSIALTHTTAGTTVLSMADATGFTYTGTPTITTTAAVTRTFSFGSTAGGSASNAPSLSLTSGAAVPTITTNSWFKALNFTGTTSTPATAIVNVDTLTLATGGTYTGLTPIFTRTQTWTPQFSKQLNGIGFNVNGGTLTLGGAQTYTGTSVCYLLQGTLDLGGTDLTIGIFNSNNTNTRAVAFGSNNIILAHTTSNTTVINAPDITNFTCTGTGGFSSAMSVSRVFNFGSTAGSAANAANLSLTSGASTPIITTNSWFKTLDFTGTTSTPSTTTVNVDTLTLASGGTYTELTPQFTRTQTWTAQFSKTLAGIGVNKEGEVLTLDNTQTYAPVTGNLYVQAGTLNLNSTNQTFSNLISTRTAARSITGPGSLTIKYDWIVDNGTGFTGSDYTIYMASQLAKTFAGGGGSYGTLVQHTPTTLNITGSNTFANMQVTSDMIVASQQEYTTPGTYSWTAPPGVYSVSAVCIGGGANGSSTGGTSPTGSAGGGGGLGWKNNIAVTPGATYTVVVGANNSSSYFINTSTVAGYGAGQGGPNSLGSTSRFGGGYVGDGGGRGGTAGVIGSISGAGGGGAGGYSGAGGNVETAGAGGGGGGGGVGGNNARGGFGGGTGIFGQGNNGASGTNSFNTGVSGGPGGGGSINLVAGSLQYGGGGGAGTSVGGATSNGTGTSGAVRIIWGTNRAFPTTNTTDVNL